MLFNDPSYLPNFINLTIKSIQFDAIVLCIWLVNILAKIYIPFIINSDSSSSKSSSILQKEL